MKRIFSKLAMLSLFAATACSQADDLQLQTIKHGIDVAKAQLKSQAVEFNDTNLLPRSWENGKNITIKPTDWTSGFFPGSLWLTYQLTGDEDFKAEAMKYTARLEEVKTYKHTHDLGFMIFCSYGQQQKLFKDQKSADVIMETSNTLALRYNPEVGLIRSWDWGTWNYPVIIDNMMNLEMLFWASKHSGDQRFHDIAVSHADITMKEHFRSDYSTCHVVSYNDDGTVERKQTHQGNADDSSWARGQGWGLYGYTMSYRETGLERYLEHAKHIAEFIINHPNTPSDLVPYWDYDVKGGESTPRDASAGALIASALFELSTMVDEASAKKYFSHAEAIIMNMSKEPYLAEVGTNGGFIIKHATGNLPGNSEIDVPLNYADYYYLEAVKRYLDIKGVDPLKL